MANDTLEVELLITEDKAEVVLSKTKQKLEDFVRETKKIQPTIKFSIPKESFMDLDKLEKRANETRKNFEAIAKTRLDSGNVGTLTKEVIKAQERSRQLTSDIANIKKELANPNRKSSIAFLTDELRAAEREADELNRKLSALSVVDSAERSGRLNVKGGANNLKLSGFQKTNLSYQVNDVLTMAAMGADPSRIIASQAGQIAQIFSPEQIAAFAAKYAGLVGIIGAGTAAITATYVVTKNLRMEAEGYLKTQETIAGVMNKFYLAQIEGERNFQKARADRQRDYALEKEISTDSLEQLQERKRRLEELNKLQRQSYVVTDKDGKSVLQENEVYKRNQETIQRIDDQIRAKNEESAKRTTDTIQRNNEMYERSRQNELKAAEKRNESIEKAKEKVKELGKTYDETFNNLFLKTGSNNAIAQVFAEGDAALKKLRENLKGLSPELQSVALSMQETLNANALFAARLDNRLASFDLREDAKNFRNPRETKEQIEARMNGSVDSYLAREANNAGNRYLKSIDNGKGVRVTPEVTRNLYEYSVLDNVIKSGYDANNFIPFLAQERLREGKDLTAQERLNSKLDIIRQSNPKNADQQAIADRQFLEIAKTVPASDLTAAQREAAAVASERQAARRESAEKDAKDSETKRLKLAEDRNNYLKKLVEIAEKQGLKGIEQLLTIRDERGTSTISQSPNSSHTQKRMNQ